MGLSLNRLRDLFGRRRRLHVLEEEMREHMEMLYEDNLRRGLDPVEARRQAALAFGNVLSTREESADAMRGARLESWWQDLRIAVRTLWRRPGFAASLVLILALGIGVTASIFTLVRGVLWQALPVPDAGELRLVVGDDGAPFRVSAPTVDRLEQTPELHGRVIAYSSNESVAVRLDDGPARSMEVRFVRGGFFQALRVAPHAGRLLTTDDDRIGSPTPVAVVSWRWWQQNLGGDPETVGREIRINGERVRIVGVAPERFTGISVGSEIDAWLPAGLHAPLRVDTSASISSRDDEPALADWIRDDCVSWLDVLVRQPEGMASAQGLLEAAWQPQLATLQGTVDDPDIRDRMARERPHLVASPTGYSHTRDQFRSVGLTLALLVGAVVLVTAANTSTLLLLRMLARRRELGVRLALGAGRWRLVRAALMEGLVLAVAGAAIGGLVGFWSTPALAAWLVPGAAATLSRPDPALLGSLAGLSLLLGLGLGAAPAWLIARLPPQSLLQQRVGGARAPMRLGRGLVVAQLALSVLLVAVACTLAGDLRRALRADMGFERESTVSVFFNAASAGFSQEQVPALTERLRAAARAMPAVRSVGFALCGALSGSRWQSGMYFRGTSNHEPGKSIQRECVDEHYFDAMGLALLRGRGFSASDIAGHPRVVVISSSLARQVFGDADPIGRRLGFDMHEGDGDMEIVGVVADVRMNGVREAPTPLLYAPLAQSETPAGCMVVRVAGDAKPMLNDLQKTVSAAEPTLILTGWQTMEQRVRRWVRNDRAAVDLTAGFGVLATLLAVIGVLGALGYLVATRSREIAVRLALGASPARVRRDIVREALWLGALGAGVGLALAALLPRLLGSWMMSGLRNDVWALAFAALVGLGAAVLGGLRPALRAARVDPLTLLKAE